MQYIMRGEPELRCGCYDGKSFELCTYEHVVLAGVGSFAVAWLLFVELFVEHVVLAGVGSFAVA